MKYLIKLLVAAMLTSTVTMAMTSKVKEPKLVKGTTIGKYAKPGAPVNITYTTEHVDIGEKSIVNIVLSTSLTSGSMNVQVNVDKNLEQFTNVAKEYTFVMSSNKKEFPLDLIVSAQQDGLYYVKLLVSIKGKGFRAFAVPVYIGAGKDNRAKKTLQKNSKGENISVSQGIETIK